MAHERARPSTLWALCAALLPLAAAAQSLPTPGDGLFKPTIHPVAPIDKRPYPITVEVAESEPRFAHLMTAGSPTGDSYVIHFPQGDTGGPCSYTGKGRYVAESTGALMFELLAQCGKLQRGYSYLICMLGEDLRCAEAPQWYFTGRTYALKPNGLAVNGTSLYAWRDPAQGPQFAAALGEQIKARAAHYLNAPNTLHGRSIDCRSYDPATRQSMLHEFGTQCLLQKSCPGMPDLTGVRDGDVLPPSSPLLQFVKQQSHGADVSGWVCWTRSH